MQSALLFTHSWEKVSINAIPKGINMKWNANSLSSRIWTLVIDYTSYKMTIILSTRKLHTSITVGVTRMRLNTTSNCFRDSSFWGFSTLCIKVPRHSKRKIEFKVVLLVDYFFPWLESWECSTILSIAMQRRHGSMPLSWPFVWRGHKYPQPKLEFFLLIPFSMLITIPDHRLQRKN